MMKSIKNIFAVNNTVNFSPRSCRAASSSIAKRIDVTEYATGDIEFNRICRVCNV